MHSCMIMHISAAAGCGPIPIAHYMHLVHYNSNWYGVGAYLDVFAVSLARSMASALFCIRIFL